jgi:hypothetical protein
MDFEGSLAVSWKVGPEDEQAIQSLGTAKRRDQMPLHHPHPVSIDRG